jgi:D-arabinose 5-phosphate isomerase GutQ
MSDSSTTVDVGVIHGRFQILHNDHLKYLLAGKDLCRHLVIGITNPDSPLAECCTVVLGVTAPEDTEVYMPMSSRIIHLSVIDVLATGVTLKRGHDFLGHLKKIKESLKATRFPPN